MVMGLWVFNMATGYVGILLEMLLLLDPHRVVFFINPLYIKAFGVFTGVIGRFP